MGPKGQGVGMEPTTGDRISHMDPYGYLLGPLGPMGPIFIFSDFCPLGPPRIFRKVSVVMPEEQLLPITQKRHCHMVWFQKEPLQESGTSLQIFQ